jgi:uncharacterized protein YjbI with pentapeptide repeats
MDYKKIKIDDYKWTSRKVTTNVTYENLESFFYSWGEFSTPTSYIKCDGNNIAIRKCTITSQLFIECNFNGIDASDTMFIDCLFRNCTFEKANFCKTSFIGTAIIQDKYHGYEEFGAGMSQSQFRNSELNYSILSNINLNRCNFRHSVFENTIFNKVSTEYTTFEDAYLNNCIIDILNLKKSACRGIIINDCKIGKYISSFEKTLGGIGVLQILESCNDIELYMGDEKFDKLDKIRGKLKDVSENFLREGKFFEFINIMNYLYTLIQRVDENYISDSKKDIQLFIKNSSTNGYLVSERGEFLYKIINYGFEAISDNGKKINLDDILYSLKLMFFLGINEYILLKLLLHIYKNEMLISQNSYSNFLIVSQIQHYFQIIGSRIKSTMYKIILYNETALWLNQDDRNHFYDFCHQFFTMVVKENSDFKLVSMHEGSIEVVFVLSDIRDIIIIAAILGCEFKFKDGNLISFSFNLGKKIKQYVEFMKLMSPIAPLMDLLNITKDIFNTILKKTKDKALENLEEYVKKNKITGRIEQETPLKEITEYTNDTQTIETVKNGTIIRKKISKQKKVVKKYT